MLALIPEMSLRHLISAPLRSLLVVVGIALGVAVLVASQATSRSMLISFEELVERVAGRADLMVVGNQSGIENELVSRFAEVEGVQHVAAALEVTTHLAGDRQPLLVLGVDFLGDTHFLPFQPGPGQKNVVEDPLAFANEPTAILITQTLARRRGLKLDSQIKLLTSEGMKTFHVRGILEDSGPAASFGGQVAVMFLDAAQISFARGTLVDRIDIAVSDGVDIETVQQRISQAVGDTARVERPEQVGERLGALSQPLRNGLRLSGLVALMVGMFIIYNAIGISVAQRRKETGLLRALGVIRRTVVFHFCIEAVLLAVPGAFLGLLLAQQLVIHTHDQTAEAINRLYVATLEEPRITLGIALQGVAAGLAISIMAAFIPARRGAAMDPVSALRSSAVLAPPSSVPYRTLGIAGLCSILLAWAPTSLGWSSGGVLATVLNLGGAAMIAPAVVVLLRRILVSSAEAALGIPARLGLDYVERNLGRSSINVLALMVAVSMSVSVSGWLNSFEHSIRKWFDQIAATDLTITAGSPFVDRRHVPLIPAAVDRIVGIEGIAEVQPVRVIEQRLGERTFTLSASDTSAYLSQAKRRKKTWKILDGRSPIEPNELQEKPLIVIGENAANRLALKAGDTMSLSTPTGEHDFEVRAVVVDYSSEQGSGFIDRRFYLRFWKDEAVDAINLYLADGAHVERVAEQVREKLGGGESLFVTKTTDLKEQFLAFLDRSFAYSRSLELIVLFIALMGVVGTMVSAVIDRVREIGMMRAVGSTRAQVVAALVVEASFLGFCAVAGGILVGTLQCLLFLEAIAPNESGWHLDFVFPFQGTLRIGLLVVATSAAAGLLPGMRAARMDIKEALAYE